MLSGIRADSYNYQTLHYIMCIIYLVKPYEIVNIQPFCP